MFAWFRGHLIPLFVLAVALVSGVALVYWASGAPKALEVPKQRAGLSFEPNNEQRGAIEALRARLSPDNPRFSREDSREKANAQLFTYLAETSEEPQVIEAALEAIQSAYSSRSSRKQAPDADLDRVLLKHLSAGQPSIVRAALLAARIPLMSDQPSAELTQAIVSMAEPEQRKARRHAALEALNLIRPDRRGAHVLASFEQALAAREPHLISLALLALSQSDPSLEAYPEPSRASLAARVLELSVHADAGVRGRALAVLAEVESLVAAGTRLRAARAGLADAHPYVRAQAADLSARSGNPMVIHRLIEHVADLAVARYDLRNWTELDGSPGSLAHSVPGRKRVADAALFAVLSLSETLEGADPLRLTLGGPQQSDELVLQNAEIARSWYRHAATRIPGDELGQPR